MAIMIKGMEMPKNCVDCRFHKSLYCTLTDICTNSGQGCPLIELPPHGRLIDADALFKTAKEHHDLYYGATNQADKARRDECLQMMCDINDAPTVIEASEVE